MPKILIIRFSSIGDIVLTTPVIRCLKKQLDGVEVHYLTKKSFGEVVQANPYIDKVWLLGDDLNDILDELKAQQFDFVADLHHNIRSWKVRKALGVKSKAFDKLNIEKWLLVNFKIDQLPKKHIVSRYIETLSDFGVHYDGEGLDYFISKNDEVDIQQLPEPWSKGYVGFVIGAKHATKRLPVEKIISVINKMKLPIMLLGGKEDYLNAETIRTNCSGYVLNGCGNYRLGQSASLVKQAQLVITHDTGLMHIAAAFQKRIISVWGNTVPEFGMTPFVPDASEKVVIAEVKDLYCRPCSKIGFEKCPKKHFRCMRDIDENIIVSQAFKWWSEVRELGAY